MKELSIEQKAKAYDKALEKARQLCAYPTTKPFISDLQDIFPELKESEDERMVKFIKKQLFNIKKTITENYELDAKLTKAIDWLEKQCEHAKFRDSIQVGDKVTRNQDGVLVNQSQLKRVAKKDEKQGEQKQELLTKEKALKNSPFVEQKSADKVEPKFKVGDIIKPKCYNETHSIKAMGERYYILDVDIKIPFRDEDEWELVEQKPAWSEEDEKLLKLSLDNIAELKDRFGEEYGRVGDCIKWLKSIKDRVQPKQEWSEEDEQMLNDIIKDLVHPWNEYIPERIEDEIIWLKNRLKSIRPQSHWKPSDEQMRVLDLAIRCGINRGTTEETTLVSLFNDLKKLKS